MASREIDKLIVDGIRERGGAVTWNQIADIYSENGFIPYGTRAMVDETNIHAVYWIGEDNLIWNIEQLREDKVLDIFLIGPMLYIIDGAVPDLPIIKEEQLSRLAKGWKVDLIRPTFVPTLIMLRGAEPPGHITSQMLAMAIEASDDGALQNQEIEHLLSKITEVPALTCERRISGVKEGN